MEDLCRAAAGGRTTRMDDEGYGSDDEAYASMRPGLGAGDMSTASMESMAGAAEDEEEEDDEEEDDEDDDAADDRNDEGAGDQRESASFNHAELLRFIRDDDNPKMNKGTGIQAVPLLNTKN